jgi:DNA ligase (NAD+)
MTISEIYILLNDNKFIEVTAEVKKLNKAYRDGSPLITDPEYDRLIETIKLVDPENEIFTSGVIETLDEVDSDRKELLKYPMFSLDKEKSLEEIFKWLLNKGLPLSTMLVCTAKYDGISILKDEWTLETWSRGDGIEGETVTEHYKKLNDKSNKIKLFTIGELLIPKPVFASHTFYRDNGEAFKNARNMIAGLKNSDTISNDLQYAKHVRYGFADEDFLMNKSEQLDFITTHLALVPYRVFRADALKIEELNDLFIEWGKEYDIDGLVIDIDDKNIRRSLGRERNNNPCYSRAFKNPEWSENAETEIVDIEWNISKLGYLKPVGILTPIDLEGVTISRVTLNNAKYVKDNNLSRGSKIVLKRSGGVIPKVVGVIKATGFEMPEIKGSVVFWNDNGVELCVSNTNDQEIKKIISFFEILKTDNVSEGVVNQLYNAGYTTIKQILNLSISDFEKLDKFGKRKAEIVYNAIKKATTDVDLAKLMHASGCYINLGSKKLELLIHFTSKPSYNDILAIKGFSDISANNFLDGYDKYQNFIKDLPITTKSKKQEQPKNNNSNMKKSSLEGMSVLFTGVRRQDLVDEIEARGGKNLSAISKNVTHLICKDKNSSSSKMVKAKELGIQIMSVEELEMYLNK